MSIHVAPLSSEYCSFATATSSVAARLSLTGPRYHGLRMPVKLTGSSVAAASAGADVSGACATAGPADSNDAAATTAASPRLETTLNVLLLVNARTTRPGSVLFTNL